jgi:hypothetical protein
VPFSLDCQKNPQFELVVRDGRGRRVDLLPFRGASLGVVCGRRTTVVTLPPAGEAYARLTLSATQRELVAGDRGAIEPVVRGSLGMGQYDLEVVLPMVGATTPGRRRAVLSLHVPLTVE